MLSNVPFFATLLVVVFVLANPNTTFGDTETFVGVRVSKSGIVHLADMDTRRNTRRLTYLPAGKRLFVYARKYRHKGREWLLALTDYGVYVYVLKDGTHYYNPEERDDMTSSSFAVIEQPRSARPEGQDEDFSFGPSEVYQVLERKGFDVLLHVEKDERFHSSWPDSVQIWVPEDILAVYEPDDIHNSSVAGGAIRRKNLTNDLVEVRKAMKEKGGKEEVINSLIAALDRRLIESKECEPEIDGTLDLNALGELDLDSILSPVSAALKLSGSIRTTVKYPSGMEFHIDRYARTIPGQSQAIIEIKHETHRKDLKCSSSEASRRLVISTSLEERAELEEKELRELGLRHNEGYPLYSCTTDYFKLYGRLVNEKALEPDTAALVLAFYARYTGGSRATECKP